MHTGNINAIGISYGELSLKGKNRGQFENILKNSIKKVLKNYNYSLQNDMSKPYILVKDNNYEDLLTELKKVFGIVNLSPSIAVEIDKEIIKKTVIQVANEAYENGARNFKINVIRSNKKFEDKSMDFARELGGDVLENTPFENVKMKNPDAMINVEIRGKAYIYKDKVKTFGGLPLGSSGKAVSLLSGGIDSPVASFEMAKRGMKIIFVTFHSFPFTSKQALDKIKDLVQILSTYNLKSRLYSMNILKIQEKINKETSKEYATILTRRVMMVLAKRLAEDIGAGALITGESLGQVASQTIGGLTCTNESVKDMVVLRPLIGMDKVDIINTATKIGTYEKSIEPFEDSCVIFAPKHPSTNPKIEDIKREEEKMQDYTDILDEIYLGKEHFDFE